MVLFRINFFFICSSPHINCVSFLVETEVQEIPKTQSYFGTDVGQKAFAILSNGTIYKNPKFFRLLEEKLARAQCILSRRTKGSSRWNK